MNVHQDGMDLSGHPDEVLLFGNFNQMRISDSYLMDDIDNNAQHQIMLMAIYTLFSRRVKGKLFARRRSRGQIV